MVGKVNGKSRNMFQWRTRFFSKLKKASSVMNEFLIRVKFTD